MFILLFFTLLTSHLQAYPYGFELELSRFVSQIEHSEPFLENALSRFQAEFNSSLDTISSSTYSFNSPELAAAQSPIASIQYGYVSYNNTNTNFSNYYVAGADNAGMYALEVHFKSLTEKPDISLYLADRSLLFIAYGSGADHPIIYRNSDSDDLSDPNGMSTIAGFVCINKNKRCTQSSGTHPEKSCNGSLSSLYDNPAGVTLNTNDHIINMFHYTSGFFSLCAIPTSIRNCMSSGTC